MSENKGSTQFKKLGGNTKTIECRRKLAKIKQEDNQLKNYNRKNISYRTGMEQRKYS